MTAPRLSLAALDGFALDGSRPAGAPARAKPVGRVFADAVEHPPIRFFYYLPQALNEAAIPLVCVHGISRNALEHLFAFRSYAEQIGAPLIAPLFDRKTYRGYQTLGMARSWNALSAFDAVLDQARAVTDAPTDRVNLFGYSGGAQFVHRYAMANPARVNAFAIASAGWYTMPNPKLAFPLGAAGGDLPACDLEAFLARPMLAIVGAADTTQDSALRRTKKLDALEGTNRVERAQSWVRAINAAAADRERSRVAAYVELKGAGHSFADCVKAGIADHVFSFLYPRNLTTNSKGNGAFQ